MARLLKTYLDEIAPSLQKQFAYDNVMMIPKMEKISINMGIGEAVNDKKVVDAAIGELSAISGQKPMVRKAKKSIAAFKLREGVPVGVSVTLRGKKMYEFIDRFVNIALPAVRDFRGLSAKSFDGSGNFNYGVKEQVIFPEVTYDQVSEIRGMNITFVTTARSNNEAKALLKGFNFPFINIK